MRQRRLYHYLFPSDCSVPSGVCNFINKESQRATGHVEMSLILLFLASAAEEIEREKLGTSGVDDGSKILLHSKVRSH